MFCQTETEFREIPRLRIKTDDDGLPISLPNPRDSRYEGDHLYFHGPGFLGIYIDRTYIPDHKKARKAMRLAAARYHRMIKGLEVERLSMYGDMDGIIIFRPKDAKDIPKTFFKADYKINLANLKKGTGQDAEFCQTSSVEGSHRLPDLKDPKEAHHGPGLTWTKDAEGRAICITGKGK